MCDVGNQARDFDISKTWTYLLFDEFFEQGDLELKEGLPISMLCDRNTTMVYKTQPGFINFIPLPLFTSMTHILPELSECVKHLKSNMQNWKDYEEIDEDKFIYLTKEQKIEAKKGQYQS